MGAIILRSLEDMARWRADLRVNCKKCGREGRFDPHAMIRWFAMHRWSTSLDDAPRRFRCAGADGTGCGSKDVRLSAVMPTGELPPERPRAKPMDPSRVPMGIDPAVWATANERERKRLVQRARS